MRHSSVQPIFENRYDAGQKLAEKLTDYTGKGTVVLGIPNGGVAVALGVALALKAELDLIISRKLPLPQSPEGGFGSITDDGTIILNEELVKKMGLTRQQIEEQIHKVKSNIEHRSSLYYDGRPPVRVAGRTIIIVDDGLASGYTMRAAVTSLRKHQPGSIIAAVPVGTVHAVKDVQRVADKVVTCTVGTQSAFYVADYYQQWYDVPDNEVLSCLREWQIRSNGDRIQLPERKQRLK